MVHSRLPRPVLLAAVLTASLTASLTVEAAEWVAEPSVSLREEYNDNIRLTNVQHDNAWGTILDPQIKLARRSEVWDVNASGRLRAARYTGQDGLDTVDNYFDVAAKRKLERGSLDTSASLINDTTLQNEVLDFDTGLVVNQIDRTQHSLRLVGEYLFTQATWLEASVNYNTAKYAEGSQYGLVDYTYLTPGLRIVHQLDPQTQVFGILNHSKVDYDTTTNQESTTDSLQIGASYDITETWNIRGSIGSRRTSTSSLVPTAAPIPGLEYLYPFGVYDIVYIPRDSDSTGLVYDANLTRKFETGSLSLSGSQSVMPGSTGTDITSTQINFTGTRNFSAKLSAQLAVSYYRSATVGDVSTTADSGRYRVAPSLTWHLDRDMTLNTGYSFTRIDRSGSNSNDTDSNTVFASIGYMWPRISASR